MIEAVQDGRRSTEGDRPRIRRRTVAVVALAGLALLASLVGVYLWQRGAAGPTLVPEAELDTRWGTYLSEREWGTPREAVGGNGWGLSWRGAIDTEYGFSDDGIAGITDVDNEFRISWAFWDGQADHVTERFNGLSNPQGRAGETIVDDRIMLENTPNHGYARMVYRYPTPDKPFEIELEMAKLDSTSMVLQATVTNTTADDRSIDVVLKASTEPDDEVSPVDGGFLLSGDETALAVVADNADGWHISAAKDALDTELRGAGLSGNGGGQLGALAFKLELAGNATETVSVALDEVALADAAGDGDSARRLLSEAGSIMAARRVEAGALFATDVTAHADLYRQSLMSLLWSKSFYRWDGTSGVNPKWAGKVDAHDLLILPDKWEYPWFASWDTGFHAVTATLVDPELAADQMRFTLSDRWQQADGHIPCAEWVMDQECPPIFAWVTWRIYETSNDIEFLQQMYPRLQAHYDYWWQNTLVDDALFGGGFMGMDNLPRGGGAQADSSAWMAFFARDMVRIATELGDAAGAERYWTDRGRIQQAINERLWDAETGFYYDLNADGEPLRYKSYSGLIPLIAGVVPAERIPVVLAALRDPNEFLSVAGIRSMAATERNYVPGTAGPGVNSNWRGPIWLPINYLLVQALADIDPPLASDLRTRLINTVEADWKATGRFHEFFDGDTGAGLGADAQAGWTALVANLIAEGWPAPP